MAKALKITEVANKADLKRWVMFQQELYREAPKFVPPLIADEMDFFSKRNPVYEVARQKMFLAERDGKLVGRVSAVIHSLEQKKLGVQRGRFGWFDCVDDEDVAKALLDACREWLKAEGCTEMTGPHGFTDLDLEGLLVEGFDELPTIAGSYNYPYYQKLIEGYGLQKDVDYLEFRFALPAEDPKLFARARESLKDNPNYRAVTCQNKAELMKYAPKFWVALEETFAHLYGVTPLTEKQQQYYTKKYFSFLDPNFVHFVLDKKTDDVVGFFVTMPNLSRALQKAKGRILPFGIFHLLSGMKKADTVDFLLAGVKEGHPSPTLTTMMALNVLDSCRKKGIKFVETNRELETNTAVNRIWAKFDPKQHRRSRMYRMAI